MAFLAGRRSRDQRGDMGAPRKDGLDVRWGETWKGLVSRHPEELSELWILGGEFVDQGMRAKKGYRNPFLNSAPKA